MSNHSDNARYINLNLYDLENIGAIPNRNSYYKRKNYSDGINSFTGLIAYWISTLVFLWVGLTFMF
jgi:hypothetical protein